MLWRTLVAICLCFTWMASCTAPEGGDETPREVQADASTSPDKSPPESTSATVKVMTFNILCSFCAKDGYDKWAQRLPHLQALIKRHDADLIGMQEQFVTNPDGGEITALVATHPVYEAIYYKAKEGEPFDYPDATIYYRRERFEAREHGFFWLSPTPDTPFSKGFADGGQLYRLVAWTRLYDKTSRREFVFATTHFDNNPPSQEKSVPLVLQRLGPMAKTLPLIFVGDYNSKPSSKAYKILTEGIDGKGFKLQNSFDLVGPDKWRAASDVTPPPAYDTTQRIDHIFVAGGTFQVSDWVVDLTRYGEKKRRPSDHWAMIAVMTF